MARKLRRKSAAGYYHLILRGNNKQILFEATDDYRFFLSRMGKYCRESDIRISAYCLMENHVHLLVKDPQDSVPAMMQKLSLSYSFYYNQKYGRTGHLFQGRYLSEPVENDFYLLTVFRYILNNPRKAGICPAPDYRWSSYRGYFRPSAALDLDFIREQYPTAEAYREYISQDNEDECLEYTQILHPYSSIRHNAGRSKHCKLTKDGCWRAHSFRALQNDGKRKQYGRNRNFY